MSRTVEVEVRHEEIIVHPSAERTGWKIKGTARIMGEVLINGKRYTFEHVVEISFTDKEERLP